MFYIFGLQTTFESVDDDLNLMKLFLNLEHISVLFNFV
jgi:hypothetical protein